MENKVVNLQIKNNLDEVTKDVKKLSNSFEDTSQEIKGIQKSTKAAEDGVKSLSSGFKGMGLAVKAIGIGLVMEAFNMFKEILGKNQKVVDLFNTAIGALSIAFNDLIGFVMDNFPSVIKIFKDIFENPTTYLKKFGDLIKESLIERFNSFLDTIGFVGDALKKVFQGDFAGAMESVKKAGKESLDILTGVNDSFDKGKKIIGDAAEAIADYAVKTFKASEANVKLQNSAILAAAEQGRLVEQYDRQAEKLRQIRDNDLLSIEDRIKANNELKEVLEKQQEAMLAQASLQVAAAQATFAMNKSIENQAAVTDALANKEGVLAQIEGLRSEQMSNSISLQKEKIELGQSEVENLNNLSIEQKKFNESLQTDELLKLENQRANLEEEKRIELERLQLKIDTAIAGTQAKVDAENEYAIKSQEINNALTTNQIETNKVKLDNERALADAKININNSAIQSAQGLVQLFAGLGEKNKGIQKAGLLASSALSIAEIINNTNVGSSKEVATKGIFGLSTSAILYAKMGISIASVLAATSKGLKGLGGGSVSGGSNSSPTSSSPTSQAPSFNVVGASQTNQLAQSIGQQQNQPIRTYVVSSDVSTAQSLDRNIITSASIG
tara:strand:- start:95 stop:1933 length:1839 start_codon:yes stop_codon:yes gene_type:complete